MAEGVRYVSKETGASKVPVAGYTGAKGLIKAHNKVADHQANWLNDKYKNHIAGLPPIQWSRAGLGATSDGLGAIETRAAWLARRTDSPFTANIPLATSRTASFFKDEVNRWDHILRDPKGWWDQASGLDKAGVAATFAPFGVLGKGLVKGAKEALGLGKHADDVKKAPTSPKSPDSGDTGPGSGRSGSDGGPRKSDPTLPRSRTAMIPLPSRDRMDLTVGSRARTAAVTVQGRRLTKEAPRGRATTAVHGRISPITIGRTPAMDLHRSRTSTAGRRTVVILHARTRRTHVIAGR